MKSPIPTPTARFNVVGMARSMVFDGSVSERVIRKMIPSGEETTPRAGALPPGLRRHG